MSKLDICNTGTTARSELSAQVVLLYKERINQIKSNHIYHKHRKYLKNSSFYCMLPWTHVSLVTVVAVLIHVLH